MVKSLWNIKDIDSQIKNSPNEILREQATYFEKETKQVLYAALKNIKLNINNNELDYKLATHFIIVAPSLDNYSYTLFTVYSNPEANYPVAISIDNFDDEDTSWISFAYKCEGETEYINAITEILGSEKTTEIIKTLYSKSKAY